MNKKAQNKIDSQKIIGAFTAFGFAIAKRIGKAHPQESSILEDAQAYGKLITDDRHLNIVAEMINDDELNILLCPPHEFSHNNKCVHTEHCCAKFGCKYGEEDSCPVWLGYAPQSFPYWDGHVVHQMPNIPTSVFIQRRLESA